MNSITSVIAAISTPPGKGGVAVIRMSGEGALDILSSVFVTKNGKKASVMPPRVQIYGYILDGDDPIDDVLATYFPAPNSYTGEDVVEISCHGGILVSRTVLSMLLRSGAAYAEAGEFTKRAFLNGKLTLAEAEGIGALLDAESREQMRLGSEPSRRRLSSAISGIRDGLVRIMSSVYARIDYPDEDLGDLGDAEVCAMLTGTEAEISSLLSTYRTGRAITEGVRTVICGRPNVGKSSFYNLLIGEDSAIVTSIAGTTRDVLERSTPLGGVMLRLADTAGIRESDNMDPVERIGVRKSLEALEKSELIFAIFDISEPLSDSDREIISLIDKQDAPKIALLNKSDLTPMISPSELAEHFSEVISLSSEHPEADAMERLSDCVRRLFLDGSVSIGADPVIYSERQRASLERALGAVRCAREALESGLMQDAASFDVERAIEAISELDGKSVNDQIVADIFSRFCVGK